MRVLGWPAFEGSGNPYCPLLYGNLKELGVEVDDFCLSRAFLGRYNVWHLHWPDYYLNQGIVKAFLGIHKVLFCVLWARFRRAKIVWTVHNLVSHNRRHARLERFFWSAFTHLIDGFISMSQSGVDEARSRFPFLRDLPAFVVPHGHYRTAYLNETGRVAARAELSVPSDARVFLFFGGISAYKNVPRLIEAFRQSPCANWRLHVAGHISSDMTASVLRAAAGDDARIMLHLGWIAAEQVQIYMQAADLVVLPFNEIFNSGSAILTLSFDRPLLAPAQGALPELQSIVGSDWLRTYSGPLTTTTLSEAMEWAISSGRGEHAPLDALEWPALARKTLAAYRAICDLPANAN